MDKVCITCGSNAKYENMVTCSQCKKFSQHKYCIKVPILNIHEEWRCDICNPPYKQVWPPPGKVKFISEAEVCKLPAPEYMKKHCKSPDLCMKVPPVHAKPSASKMDVSCKAIVKERATGKFISMAELCKLPAPEYMKNHCKSPDLCMKVSPVHAKPSASKMDVSCKAILKERATGMLASVLPRIKMEVADIPIESDCLDNNIQPIETHVEEMAQLVTPSGLQWKGKLEILDVDYDGIQAHFPGTIAQKAYNALRRLPERLKVELLPRVTIWPKSFDMDGPCYQDFAFYLSPDDNARQKYICLLNDVTCQDLGMRCSRNGADLLIFSSEKLPLYSQRKDGELYLWGLFCSKKCKGPADIPPGFSRPH